MDDFTLIGDSSTVFVENLAHTKKTHNKTNNILAYDKLSDFMNAGDDDMV